MASNNPFATLVTPDVLKAQREAAFAQQYANADPWTRMAAEAGFKMAEKNRELGYGLTEEDIKAKRNETIMAGAQSKFAELVKDGKMSADEAQAEVLQEAIAGFAANGSWEQALALTQPLNELRKQSLERRKLKAEAVFQETRPDIEAQKADATTMRAETAAELADLKRQIAEAKTGAEVALLNAKVTALLAKAASEGSDGGDGKKSVYDKKRTAGSNEVLLASAAAANLMKGIKEIGLANPRALTQNGAIMTQIATVSESAKALMQGNGYDPEADINRYSRVIRDNIDDQKMQALVVDLAFAFARVRDPGGRLSNQDVENAIKIVSGSGSPQARLETLDQAFSNMKKTVANTTKVNASEGYDATQAAKDIWNEAAAAYEGTGKKPAAPAAGPPLGLTRKQFEEWRKQNPNWKP